MFCYDSDVDPPAASPRSCVEDDEYFMVYEQDCSGDSSYYYSMYVARFRLSDIHDATAHKVSNP